MVLSENECCASSSSVSGDGGGGRNSCQFQSLLELWIIFPLNFPISLSSVSEWKNIWRTSTMKRYGRWFWFVECGQCVEYFIYAYISCFVNEIRRKKNTRAHTTRVKHPVQLALTSLKGKFQSSITFPFRSIIMFY